MCLCDCLHTVVPNKFYINGVIASMVVRAAVNQKKRENETIAQFVPDLVENNIRAVAF